MKQPLCPRCEYPINPETDKYCPNCGLPMDPEELEEDRIKDDNYSIN